MEELANIDLRRLTILACLQQKSSGYEVLSVYHDIDMTGGWPRFTVRCAPGKGFCLRSNGYHLEDQEASPVYLHVTPQGMRQECMAPGCAPFFSHLHPLIWNSASTDAKGIEVAVTFQQMAALTPYEVGDAVKSHFWTQSIRRYIRRDPLNKKTVFLKPWPILFPSLQVRDITTTWRGEMERPLDETDTPAMRSASISDMAAQRKRNLALEYTEPENPEQLEDEQTRMPDPRRPRKVKVPPTRVADELYTYAELNVIEAEMTRRRLEQAREAEADRCSVDLEQKSLRDKSLWSSLYLGMENHGTGQEEEEEEDSGDEEDEEDEEEHSGDEEDEEKAESETVAMVDN
jgi:hypothetical protein